jgi:S1-C subfamily serine protease
MQTGTENFSALSNTLADTVAHAARFVVAVNGNSRLPASGVIWGDGVIVTADHTLRRDEDITVVLPDNRTVAAKLAGRDPGTDLAVLQTDPLGIAAAEFAPAASLQVGNMVLAVGRRGENGPCASLGVISALGGPWRTWRNGQIGQFVRADLNLYPGSSGGALVNAHAQVIGINSAGLTRNWSVTVPNETVDTVIQSLLAHGHVTRGFLGVGLHPVRLPDGRGGLIVLSVDPEGSAAKSGLLIGDVVLALEGRPIEDTDDVQAHLSPEQVGKSIAASVYRAGAVHEIALQVGSRSRGSR